MKKKILNLVKINCFFKIFRHAHTSENRHTFRHSNKTHSNTHTKEHTHTHQTNKLDGHDEQGCHSFFSDTTKFVSKKHEKKYM